MRLTSSLAVGVVTRSFCRENWTVCIGLFRSKVSVFSAISCWKLDVKYWRVPGAMEMHCAGFAGVFVGLS